MNTNTVEIYASYLTTDSLLGSSEGQESSSRYINFTNQSIINPLDIDIFSDEIRKLSNYIQQGWVNFYDYYLNRNVKFKNHVVNQFPKQDNQNQQQYEKAINARIFDILRGYLPAGITTQLSWHTNLRQAHEKLYELEFHPLKEIRQVSNELLAKLKDKYSSSFSHKENLDINIYQNSLVDYTYYKENILSELGNSYFGDNSISIGYSKFSFYELEKYLESHNSLKEVLKQRPKWSKLPKLLKKFGVFDINFSLDYGSFRDLQRHRDGLCQMPILNGNLGFNDWYIEQFPEDEIPKIKAFLDTQFSMIQKLYQMVLEYDSSDVIEYQENIEYYFQYFYPLGMNVAVELIYSLPQIYYVSELRSQETVHPTLRTVCQKIGKYLLDEEFSYIKNYVDYSEDKFSFKRGKQDIIEK